MIDTRLHSAGQTRYIQSETRHVRWVECAGGINGKLEAEIIQGTPAQIRERLAGMPADHVYRLVPVESPAAEEGKKPFWATATREEWLKAWDEFVESQKLRDKGGPALADWAMDRESIYEGRE